MILSNLTIQIVRCKLRVEVHFMKQLRHANQYSTRDPRPLYLLLGVMALGFTLWIYGEFNIIKSTVPFSPLGVSVVKAQEPAPQPIVVPLNTYKAPAYMVDHIKSLFKEDTQNILTIVGTCENGEWDQSATNTNKNGTKDWGIGQINDANSKLCRGLDFKNDWKQNIDCMYRVYKSQGLSAWSCSHTVGIDPFYVKGAK